MSELHDIDLFLDRDLALDNAIDTKLLSNPLLQKDIWNTIDDLGSEIIQQHDRTLTINFQSIKQGWLRLLAKLYILLRSERQLSAAYLNKHILCLSRFSQFIDQKCILSPNQIDNQLFDEFEYYLHSLKLSRGSISSYYTALSTFFNLCREEKWLEVNTYWFKGKVKYTQIKNDKIEYIPEEVWQQLDEHLHQLPEPLQRMVIVIRGTGLRIGELLNLPLDCLRQRDKQWRLRFLTEKYRTTDELPICEELVVVIKEQQEYIRYHFADSYDRLFGSNNPNGNHIYRPAARVMASDTFNIYLNKLAQEQNICTEGGEKWHFKSHQFRRTLATIMTNAGVRDLIIQKYLRHRSPDMQNHYKHLLQKVLGEEYRELMKGSKYVNSLGEMVAAHKPQNPITELLRRKMHQITTQYGECHRKVLKSPCQTINACWRCEHWLTSIENLSVLKDDFKRVEIELAIASELGLIRQQQILATDYQSLSIRIEGLEKLDGKN
jgi:integrase/recombinase XerD